MNQLPLFWLLCSAELWVCSMSLFHEPVPWVCSESLFHDSVPWDCSMTLFHETVPWLCSMSLFRDSVPWDCFVNLFHDSVPWLCSMTLLHEPVPWTCSMSLFLECSLSLFLPLPGCHKTKIIKIRLFEKACPPLLNTGGIVALWLIAAVLYTFIISCCSYLFFVLSNSSPFGLSTI